MVAYLDKEAELAGISAILSANRGYKDYAEGKKI